MASVELYSQVKPLRIKSFVHEQVQGTSVNTDPNPEQRLSENALNYFSMVGVDGKYQNGSSIPHPDLVLITREHGRSYELKSKILENVFFKDEFGNIFSSLTSKGSNLTEPHVFPQSITPSGYAVHGLQDSDSIVRVIKASQLMRQNNIDTEMIVGLLEPQELPFELGNISLKEFKGELLKGVWNSIKNLDTAKLSHEDIPKISKALAESTFFITIRAMQVAERIKDLNHVETASELKLMLENSLKFANVCEHQKFKQNPEYKPDFFEIDKEEDIKRYLFQYLPKKCAENYAKLHNLNLMHVYSHDGNVTLAGSIVDLDSIKGKSLFEEDAEITSKDKSRDVDNFLENIRQTFFEILAKQPSLGDEKEIDEFCLNFYQEYLNRIPLEGNLITNIVKIYDRIEYSKDLAATNLLNELLEVVTKKTGFDYHFNASKRTIINHYLKGQETIWLNEIQCRIGEIPLELRIRNLRLPVDYLAPELKSNMKKTIHTNMIKTKGAEVGKLLDGIGTENGKVIINMFIDREFKEAENKFPKEDSLFKYEIAYYKKWIKKNGWENDIVTHVPDLLSFFNDFGFVAESKILNYYCNLLEKQLGVQYEHPETINDLKHAFYQKDKKIFQKYAKKAIAKSIGPVDVDEIFTKIQDENDPEGIPKFFRFASDRFIDSFVRRLPIILKRHFKAELNLVEEKYGKEIADSVAQILTRRQEQITERSYKGDEIDSESAKRLESLKSYFRYKIATRGLKIVPGIHRSLETPQK